MLIRRGWIVPYAFLFCFTIPLLFSGCATRYGGDDSWMGRDKAYHFIAGGIIGAGATIVVKRNGVDTGAAPVIGVSTTLAVGGGKEWYDANIKGTFWSWKDMAWDFMGGAAGSYLALRVK